MSVPNAAGDDSVDGDRTRIDPYTDTVVHIVGTRQGRPNLPSTGCPFCVGGLEAPEPYDVRWFKNRWPAMAGDACEVVLYTDAHDDTFASLGVVGARKVIDLWADRTRQLGARDGVDYVLVFENRGPEVGATIAHPHGQIYAFDHIPHRQLTMLRNGWRPDFDEQRLVASADGWRSWVPYAPVFPVSVQIAPEQRIADLVEMPGEVRDGLAAMLIDVLDRLDRLYGQRLPYMMWLNQRPTVSPDPSTTSPQISQAATVEDTSIASPPGKRLPRESFDESWFNIEIVSPWRAPGVQRFIAAAEVATEEYFNPVIPEVVADQLRQLASGPDAAVGPA